MSDRIAAEGLYFQGENHEKNQGIKRSLDGGRRANPIGELEFPRFGNNESSLTYCIKSKNVKQKKWLECPMYLLSIYFENARKNGDGRFCFRKDHGKIRKWTRLPAGRSDRELLQLMALACAGAGFLYKLPYSLEKLCKNSDIPLRLEFILAAHHSIDGRQHVPPLLGSGIQIDHKGQVRGLTKKDCRLLPNALPIRSPALGTGNSCYLLLAYGSELKHHDRTDDFSFTDPFFRVTRFHSLFNKEALVTDPVAFLKRLHYRGVLKSRFPAKWTLEHLTQSFKEYLSIETGCWMEKRCDFRQEWSRLRPWQHRAALPVLDVTRHMIDAFPKGRM